MTSLDSLTDSKILLAPMVGITHYAVRQALSEFVPPSIRCLWPTEMLSSRRLPHQNEGSTSEVLFLDRQNGLCPQLLGNEEIHIQNSVEKLEAWGARAIDINMGCPVRKALRHNYGVALMGDPTYAAEITSMAVRHSKLPISVKLRAGFQRDENFLIDFAKGIEGAGASWVTLHPRTADQGRRGSADWEQIKVLKDRLHIPVIGNGDLQTLEDIDRMIEETKCDKVMMGRGLLAKPWLIAAGVQKYRPDLWNSDFESYLPSSAFEAAAFYGRFLKRVLELSEKNYDEVDGLKKFRFLVYHSCVWLEFGHGLYAKVKNAPTYENVRSILNEFFELDQKIFEKTTRVH